MFGTRVAETILASDPESSRQKAAHMEANDPIQLFAQTSCKREPSTYRAGKVTLTITSLKPPDGDLQATLTPNCTHLNAVRLARPPRARIANRPATLERRSDRSDTSWRMIASWLSLK